VRLKIHKSEVLDDLVICIDYTDDRADIIEPDVIFYAATAIWCFNGLSRVAASQQNALSSAFSCEARSSQP
jgi:hypothetical protein